MEKQTFMIVIALFYLIGIDHNCRNARNEFNGLANDIFQRHVLRQLVVAVQRQHASGQLVHNIRRRRLDDHILYKALGQLAVLLEKAGKSGKLFGCRQIAEQQQPHDFLKPKAILRSAAFYDITDINTAVKQPALCRATLGVLQYITMHITDACDTGEHTGSIRIAQATLNVILLIGVLGDCELPAAIVTIRLQRLVEC